MMSPRLLIVRLGSLGDIVHTLPVAATLRQSFPGARIDWLVDVRQRAILDLVPAIDRSIAVHPTARGFLEIIRRLRRTRYDVALDLQGLWKSAILARGSGASRVIGFSRTQLRERWAGLFYTETSPIVSSAHVIQKNLSLVTPLGVQPAQFVVKFPLDVPTTSVVVDELRQRLQLRGGESFAIINPGAAWSNKRWPPERLGQVAIAMAARFGLRSAVLWGPSEESLAQAVVAASERNAVPTPRTSIADVVAVAAAARVMISGDTGPLHIAAAVGTPIVALFGPTDPARNGPWAADDISLSRYDDCSCQYRRRCRRSAPCLLDVDVDDVLRAIGQRLAATPAHV